VHARTLTPATVPESRAVSYPAAVDQESHLTIEELRATALDLRRENERLRSLIENTSDIITIVSEDGTIRYLSPSIERILGDDPRDLVGKNVLDFVHPADVAATERVLKLAVRNPGTPQSIELRLRHRDGSWHVLEVIGKRPTSPPGMDGVVVDSRDVTERKRIEAEARQHQEELSYLARLSTMGEMAAGLAHELNQPLAAITNYAKGCARRITAGVGPPAEIVTALDKIAAQAMRAGDIIRRLRSLLRKGEARRELVDVNELVREVAHFLDTEVRTHAVRLQLDLAPELPQVCVDTIQVEQVLVNLVRNGLEELSGVEGRTRELLLQATRTSDTIEVAVSDNGAGLSAEIAEKMFDPLFSTKPGSLGMGLSISRSIVDAHGGRLWATANPSGGTTFRFTLPVDENIPERRKSHPV
jgi:two-component system sensor kinase FixL